MCREMVRVLKDLGVDVLTLGVFDEGEPPFDYEGVDFLATRILDGLSNWITKLEPEDSPAQPWYESFIDLVGLLRRPRAIELLPDSSAYATTNFQKILPTCYEAEALNVAVVMDGERERTDNRKSTHDQLADLECENNSTSSDHSQNSDQDDAQGPDSDYENHGDALSMDTSEVLSENGTDISSASEDCFESGSQSDNVHDFLDFESHIGQGSDRGPDLVNSRKIGITGGSALDSNLYPSPRALRKAAEQQKAILYDRRRDFGDDNLDTLAAMAELASTHYNLGEYMAARDLQAVVLEKRWVLLGDGDPLTLYSMGVLEITFGTLGQFEELEVMLIERQKEVFGESHPDTLLTIGNLANTYRLLGRLAEAESLEVLVLEKRREILGDGHPDTLWAISNLAVTYKNLGRLEESEGLELQVLEKQREVLGEDHPDTLGTMINLAVTYLRSGRLNAAEEQLAVAAGKQRKVLGEDHPNTLHTLGNLAWTYHEQSQFERAQELEVSVLEKQRKILGNNHPDTRGTMHDLAVTYCNLQKVREAEELEALLREEEIPIVCVLVYRHEYHSQRSPGTPGTADLELYL
ncbi:hypothetical protein MVEN_02344500 [Mycena venus]|uniref:Kinesin light chain n=1 Tax=Mycena venus TaxID=2733690 RepID=A0A8H6X4I4_9AGAR|nr:hypothetical protein MVEN_02344500 [Mycena venus]